jgi:hypothetical protein
MGRKMYYVEKSDVSKIVFQNGKEEVYVISETQNKNNQSQTQNQDNRDYNQRNRDNQDPVRQNQDNQDYVRQNQDSYNIRQKQQRLVNREETYLPVKNTSFSQFHVGLVFPQGDFGDDDMDDDDACGAAMGFNIGYKHYSPLSASGLFFVFGLDFYYNAFNSDWKDEMEEGSDDATLPVYLNVPVTAGLSYILPVSDNCRFFGEVLGGFNWSKMTNSEYKIDDYDYTNKTKFNSAIQFCYALEAGILINNYSISLRYNDLNSYKYKSKYKGNGVGSGSSSGKLGESISITNLTLAFGITF